MYIAAKVSPEEALILDQLLMLQLQLCFREDVKATTDVFCKEPFESQTFNQNNLVAFHYKTSACLVLAHQSPLNEEQM